MGVQAHSQPLAKSKSYNFFGALTGNLIEHYDKAVFGLLVPFIGPSFFAHTDPITAIIQTYGILWLGQLARPIGAIGFGIISDRLGRSFALILSLLGMSISTGFMGFLPTYEQAGIVAPMLLALSRILQNLFSAGETNGAAIYILEHSQSKFKTFISSLIESSTILGCLLAAFSITVLSFLGILQSHWHWLMWGGSLVGFIGLYFRASFKESDIYLAQKKVEKPFSIIHFKQDFPAIAAITLATGFSCMTYIMSITLMNSYLSVISTLDIVTLTSMNTALMLGDLLLLPLFGMLATYISKEKLMGYAALSIALLSFPLFLMLKIDTLWAAMFVRTIIMVAGVAFAAPFRVWTQELIPIERRCTSINAGCVMGHFLIEAPAGVVCFWLYQQTGWIAAPGFYLGIISLFAFLAILYGKSYRIHRRAES